MLKAIMVQLQHMNVRLNTLSEELCQVNTRVDRITRRQARLGGFVTSPSPSSKAFKDEDEDANDGTGDENEDEDASSSNDEEMTTSQ